jgi:hypothetical protein
MKSLCGSASEYGWSQVITWLWARDTNSWQRAVQQKGCVSANGNSVSHVDDTGAESVRTESCQFLGDEGCQVAEVHGKMHSLRRRTIAWFFSGMPPSTTRPFIRTALYIQYLSYCTCMPSGRWCWCRHLCISYYTSVQLLVYDVHMVPNNTWDFGVSRRCV